MTLVLLGSSLARSQAPAGKTVAITIENMQFTPAVVSVQRGDRVTWVNKDLFPHTVTAAGKEFDSGNIDAGASWTYVATRPGEFAYGCSYHPTMKGSLKAQ